VGEPYESFGLGKLAASKRADESFAPTFKDGCPRLISSHGRGQDPSGCPVIAIGVALIGVIGAVIATLIPNLALSERERLLKILVAEQQALASSSAGAGKSHLRQTLRHTAHRYQLLATETKVDRAKRKSDQMRAPTFVLFVAGWCLLGLASNGNNPEGARTFFGSLTFLVFLLAVITWALPKWRVRAARQEERRLAERRNASRLKAYERVSRYVEGIKEATNLTPEQREALDNHFETSFEGGKFEVRVIQREGGDRVLLRLNEQPLGDDL
jgi:hypothetical protein